MQKLLEQQRKLQQQNDPIQWPDVDPKNKVENIDVNELLTAIRERREKEKGQFGVPPEIKPEPPRNDGDDPVPMDQNIKK